MLIEKHTELQQFDRLNSLPCRGCYLLHDWPLYTDALDTQLPTTLQEGQPPLCSHLPILYDPPPPFPTPDFWWQLSR